MKNQIIILILMVFLFSSCKTDDLEVTNGNAISATTFPKTLAELGGAINGIYSPLQSQGLYGRYLTYMYDYMGDDVDTQRGTPDLLDFKNYTFTATNNDIYLYWKNSYNGISRANFILDKQDAIANVPTSEISQELKDKFIGEAKFLRAYYYFLLVQRFGDIPLYTTTEVSSSGLPKSSKEEVYQLIIEDLNDAASKLFTKANAEPGRATSGAANAVLGKVHLFRGEYALAKTAFDKVIASGDYSLTTEYFDNFENAHENNSESIFEVQFTFGGGGAWAYSDWGGQDNGDSETTFKSIEYGGLGGGFHNNDPANNLVDEYEANDPRLHANFYFLGDTWGPANTPVVAANIPAAVVSIWRKNQKSFNEGTDGGGLSDINHRAIRYADVLLMAAEVENELGNIPGALDLMNQVRDRVSMPNYGAVSMNANFPVTSKQEVFNAIVHERRVELCGEQTRFPDLLRWGMMDLIPKFEAGKHELFPIPQREFDTNTSLTSADQNPGY